MGVGQLLPSQFHIWRRVLRSQRRDLIPSLFYRKIEHLFDFTQAKLARVLFLPGRELANANSIRDLIGGQKNFKKIAKSAWLLYKDVLYCNHGKGRQSVIHKGAIRPDNVTLQKSRVWCYLTKVLLIKGEARQSRSRSGNSRSGVTHESP